MKTGLVLCVAVASAALGAVAAWPLQDAHAKDNKAAAPAASGQPSPADMAKWMATMAPGPQHKMLASMVGHWTTEISYTTVPGAPPTKSTGTDDYSMAMDGRYLMDTHASSGPMGPFKGMGITGYDNVSGMYQSVWCDSMGTAIMFAQGSYDTASSSITYTGEFKDPMSGKQTKYREVMHKVSDSEYSFQMFSKQGDAPEWLSLDIKYTRAK